MLYLVDGYNVTMSDSGTCDLPIEAQRAALVARLQRHGAALLRPPGPIVVVFDGRGGIGGKRERAGAVAVSYALSETADDEIVRRAGAAGGAVTVVTSDSGLRRRVRGDLGGRAKVLPASALFESALGTGDGAQSATARHAAGESGLPEDHERITDEMTRIFREKG